MANIKQLLIEKERFAYLENNPSLAQFFASTLDLSLIHISEPTRPCGTSRMPSSA